MILHLIMLNNYKSLIFENNLKIKDIYTKELCMLFQNKLFNRAKMRSIKIKIRLTGSIFRFNLKLD